MMIADPAKIKREPAITEALISEPNIKKLNKKTKKGYAISKTDASDAPTRSMLAKIR